MSDRIWIITGTSSGLGLALARYALARGDKVIATVRSANKFPDVLRTAGAQPLVLDFSASDAEIRQAASQAIDIYGRVDVLVNNAGSNTGVGPVEEIGMNVVREQFQANLFGPIAFTQPFITHFRTRRSGHILNISSVASVTSYPSFGAYSGSKAALDSVSDALHRELAPYGVHVHIILPGYFPTNIFVSHPQYTCDLSEEVPVAPGLSQIYTDSGQGFNLINALPRASDSIGLVGDSEKFAARVYEIVTNTGLANDLRIQDHPWIRVPMGTDSGQNVLQKLESIIENLRAIEPLWRSTDRGRKMTKL